MSEPKTLQNAIIYFSNPDNCLNYLVARRWPDGVTCPRCGSKNVGFVKSRRIWQCKTRHDHAQFSIKTGSIFEDSPITLDKWLLAMWMLANCKNGVSSYEISRATGISQKSTWFMLQRIRLAMQDTNAPKLSGEVEADESYFGGKAEFMHLDKRTRMKMAGKLDRGGYGKAIVLGLLERHTKQARVKVVRTPRKAELRGAIRDRVEPGATLYTDALKSYRGLPVDGFEHDFIDHAEEYVRGAVHTNCLENFWSLMKRALKGTYVSVEPFHLQGYADEQAFRYNNRNGMDDGDRFDLAVRQIVGKRLTWAEVTGNVAEKPFIN